ncbi:MAG TPA: YncE family protein, partial [Thermoanaerobaculia bacterium]|nr:YncE family protein [Thermoanaerobaculia bacterium]
MKKLALAFALAAAANLHAAYHVARHIPVGGTGGWDYPMVDSVAKRLYLSHSDRVEVVDLVTGKVMGTIPKTDGVHGIAIARTRQTHRGFISNGRANTMTIFDLEKLNTIAEVKTTGENPDAILFDPATARIFTFNGRGHNTTIFNDDGRILATLDLGGKPEFAQADGAGHVYVNIEDKSEMTEIDSSRMVVARTWSLAPCEEPSGLAIDREHHRLFSVCGNQKMVISDTENGKVIASVEIGHGPDGAAFDPEKQL